MKGYNTSKKGSGLDEQLRQLMTATWDGDLISKSDRDQLYKVGMIKQAHGFNFITDVGIRCLIDTKLITP